MLAGPGLNFTFLSDSTCSLKLLKDDLRTTNKLSSNLKIQIEQMALLSENFNEGIVRAVWVPGRLNLADLVTRASSNPVELINSNFYRSGLLHTGERLVDIVDTMIQDNTYLTCRNGKVEFTPREDKHLTDMGFFDPARRKGQTLKAQRATVGGINKGKDLHFIQVPGSE